MQDKKDKIILFVIGILVGAVIASGVFLIYTKTNNFDNCNMPMDGELPPEIKDGESNERKKPEGDSNDSGNRSKKDNSEKETSKKANSKTKENN